MMVLGGATLLLLLTLGIWREVRRGEERRLREGEGFLQLLRYIRAQIACFATPLPEIYAAFENEALAACGFLAVLREGGIEAALAACRDSLHAEKAERKTLLEAARELGGGYREQQLATCDYYIGALEELCRTRRAEYPGRLRLGRTLIFCGGGALLILLL